MLSRWFDADPYREMTSLRSAMDRLLEQAIVRPGSSLSSGQGTMVPPINVFEHNNQYTLQVFLPSLRPDDVELTVRQGTVVLKGRWPSFDVGKDGTWLLQEFGGGEFTRSLTLPKQVASDQVEANFDRGVLTIILPLAAHEQPKTISIHEAEGKGEAKTVSGSIEQKQKQPQLATSDGH